MKQLVAPVFLIILTSCQPPSVEITEVPEASFGGPGRVERIAGRAPASSAGQQVVLFAKSGTWWVQPFSTRPFTAIQPDSTWSAVTHLGTEYAALLVDAGYSPPKTTDTLPRTGRGVVAIATVEGRAARPEAALTPKILRFSGYDWEVVQLPTSNGGMVHPNDPSNALTDSSGALHLRITRRGDEWACAEVILRQTLGYGTYSFHVRSSTAFAPATVLGMFTWDREIDIELSQWGDPSAKNAQFVIQPYYVPANVFRFDAPEQDVTHLFRWEPGKVEFKTLDANAKTIAAHVFTSGIPSPAAEKVHMNLYVYGKSRTLQDRGVEVVIDKFEYLP